jgi:hypothetical protein
MYQNKRIESLKKDLAHLLPRIPLQWNGLTAFEINLNKNYFRDQVTIISKKSILIDSDW